MEQEITALLRLAGQSTAEVPRFPQQLEMLVRDAKRAADVRVLAPVPGGLSAAAASRAARLAA